ncbi:expressed unknown protein [Seminavis robusta]|uniref:Uncharacterized protein n=1 Tax=Seminavis robusta TaxID=568900 RepID=A0A9N8HKQ4_9STRA|nr:expressed unknown protein [Seminavis robusta]|eukprot:Sro771_g200120.1 n/a (239) ;mRNA; f:6912-7628
MNWWWLQVLCINLLAGFAAVSIFLIHGEEQERLKWVAAPSTLPLYTTDEVCRDKESNKILNCGGCGGCSNRHDIKLYHDKRDTLTGIMVECAQADFIFRGDALECLKERSGLTEHCASCWVLNYVCNTHNCIRTCIKHRYLPFLPSWNAWNSEPLDPCIACDEKLCGPVFVDCAGANRRRAGVITDIERDNQQEICNKVDWDWVLGDDDEKTEDKTKDQNMVEKEGDGMAQEATREEL